MNRQLTEDHMANREPLLDNGSGIDFFAEPLLVSDMETAVPPLLMILLLPADCRRTGIFDTIGELLLLMLLLLPLPLFVGDDDVDDVDEADDEQQVVVVADDCSGEDNDSLRVGNFVGDFGSTAAATP